MVQAREDGKPNRGIRTGKIQRHETQEVFLRQNSQGWRERNPR